MKRKISQLAVRGSMLALCAMLFAIPHAARACDVCMGGKDPNIRPAINASIFFMLGLVALMATSVGLFIRYLAKQANAPMAPHVELVQMITMPKGPNHV